MLWSKNYMYWHLYLLWAELLISLFSFIRKTSCILVVRSPNHYYYTGGSSHFKVFRLGFRLAIFVVALLVLLSLGRTEGLFPRLKTPKKDPVYPKVYKVDFLIILLFFLSSLTLKKFVLFWRVEIKKGYTRTISVTGQTFLASKGQIFLSSFSLIFPHFDPPFFHLFLSNFFSVFLIIGSSFMRICGVQFGN